MTTHVERSIEVAVPVRTAYDQWTRFEEFPRFMAGIEEVRQVGDGMTHWVAHIAGVRREWDAAILEQIPDEKVAWAATSGATNAGAVFFDAVDDGCTRVRLTLEFEPVGVVERIGDVFDVVDRQAVADLDRFKEFIEGQGSATGGWRGTIEDGDVVSEGTEARTGAGEVGAAAPHRKTADDVPGDVVAVGPTGGTESSLTTEHGGGGSTAAPDVDDTTLGHSGDPIAVDPDAGRGAGSRVVDSQTTGSSAGTSGPTADAASSEAGVAGFGTDTGLSSGSDSGVLTGDPGSRAGTGTGERVVERDYANENLTTEDVVARDFADRDVSGGSVVQRDFANRDITERDVAAGEVVDEHPGAPVAQPTSLDAADAPGPADEIGGALDPLDPRAGTADDPDNPARPSV